MGAGHIRRFLLLVVLAAAALVATSAQADTPEALFAADSSGLLRIDVHCPGDKPGFRFEGSGFLLGARVAMTARHVLVDDQGRSCTAKALQEGTGKSSQIVRWMALRVTHSKAPTDLAIAVLGTPLTGHNFSISPTSPARGKLVIAFGYALNQPLSLNQGHVAKLVTTNKIRLLSMNLLEAGGASGGPILDTAGDVVGLTQFNALGDQLSVDLAHLVRGSPSQLCFGIVAGQAATICNGAHATGLLEPDGPPQVCFDGLTAALPFERCLTVPPTALGVVSLDARCPKYGDSENTGFLIGPRLVMTSLSALIDPDTAKSCSTTAFQDLTFKSDRVLRWMGVQQTDGRVSTDVAIAVLASPLQANYFSLSKSSPRAGQTIHRLDSLYDTPTAKNRGQVTKLITRSGVRQFQLHAPFDSTSAGSPILDAAGRVVGIAQAFLTKPREFYSVDLAHLTRNDPGQFCFGLAAQYPSTVCPTRKAATPTILSSVGAPEVCGKVVSLPPFTYCTEASKAPVDAPASSSLYTKLKFTGCWITTANSFDESKEDPSISDINPQVYFVYQFNELLAGVNISLTATDPAGTVHVVGDGALPIGNPGSTMWRNGAIQLLKLDPVPDGTWKFVIDVSSGPGAGASCSYSLAVAPPTG